MQSLLLRISAVGHRNCSDSDAVNTINVNQSLAVHTLESVIMHLYKKIWGHKYGISMSTHTLFLLNTHSV